MARTRENWDEIPEWIAVQFSDFLEHRADHGQTGAESHADDFRTGGNRVRFYNLLPHMRGGRGGHIAVLI